MHIRRSGRHHTAPARAAAAAAVGAALIVPLTGAVPGTSEPAETATDAPAVADGVSPSAVPTSTGTPNRDEKSDDPTPNEDEPTPDEGTVARSEYHGGKEGGWVRLVDADRPGSIGIRATGPFDCTLGGRERTCRIAEGGILAPGFGSKDIPQPAAGGADRYYFSKDPQIEMTITDGKPTITKIDETAQVSTSPFEEPSPSPTDVPTQGPTNDPTDEPSPEPTNAPPEGDPPGDDDPRRESEPREDDRPESTAPPSSLEDPNSGNGRRSVRVPGQAGDDWAPTGDGSSQHPHDNYADPVPRAPDGDASAADDAISAENSPGGQSDGSAETSADSAEDDAADLASATGSAWAIGGLVGIAAVAIGLVVFILGRSRRRRAH